MGMKMLQLQAKRKADLGAVIAHLIRMKCEIGNLKMAVESEDFIILMTAIEEGLRHAAIVVENCLVHIA